MRFLPNLFSLGNLACGVAAIIASAQGAIGLAGMLLLASIIFDLWDGKLARMIKGEPHPWGRDMDSLADMVSFGVAPAVLFYVFFSQQAWIHNALGFANVGSVNLVLLVCSMWYSVAAALRLAKFNNLPPSRNFVGLPTTSANGLVTTAICFNVIPEGAITTFGLSLDFPYPLAAVVVLYLTIPWLMLSPLTYPKHGAGLLGGSKSFGGMLFNIVFVLSIILFFRYLIHAIFLTYVLIGPIIGFARRRAQSTPATG